jgi:hypothetical protein
MVTLAALAAALLAGGAGAPPLPPIVFVSRAPAASPGVVPGLGPAARTLVIGGRLLVRGRDGTLSEPLPRGAFDDVADPAVAPDGRRIAFAGHASGERQWRLWVVHADGSGLAPLTSPPAGADDFDPCWLGDSSLVFASTRGGVTAQYAPVAVSQLWRMDGAGPPHPLTFERNGAEEPSYDPARGRLLFARWWFNPVRPTGHDAAGVASDSVNLWHAMEMHPAGGAMRLAGGAMGTRPGAMGYQPVALADGRVAGVVAANLGLHPAPGACAVQRFEPGFRRATRLAGAVVDTGGEVYGTPRGLAAPSAVSPAALPDGRLLIAHDPGARGDFGIAVLPAGGGRAVPVIDLPGTLELDAVPLLAWRPGREARPGAAPIAGGTFRYLDRDLFEGPGAPARQPGTRLRFHSAAPGAAPRPLREVAVPPSGRVDEGGLPAGVPLFEQLVDGAGRVVATPHGPAHVAGSNVGPAGVVVRCAGCHVGHSTRIRPPLARPR